MTLVYAVYWYYLLVAITSFGRSVTPAPNPGVHRFVEDTEAESYEELLPVPTAACTASVGHVLGASRAGKVAEYIVIWMIWKHLMNTM